MLPHSRTQGPGLRAFNHGVEAVSGALPHREQQASMSILLICLFFLVGRICLLSFHANIQIFGGTASDQRPFHSARSPARAELDALACALFWISKPSLCAPLAENTPEFSRSLHAGLPSKAWLKILRSPHPKPACLFRLCWCTQLSYNIILLSSQKKSPVNYI
jgi:hypothetical protein